MKSNEEPWEVGPYRLRRVRGPDNEGRTYWRATAKIDGKSEIIWTGWGHRLDPRIAAAVLQAKREPTPKAAPMALTMRGLIGAWLAEQIRRHQAGEIAKRTIESKRARARYLSRGLGNVPMAGLNTGVVRDYLVARREGTIHIERAGHQRGAGHDAARPFAAAPQTIGLELADLRSMLRWGRRNGLPCPEIEFPRLKAKGIRRKYTPTLEEVQDVLAELTARWTREMTTLAWHTGCRRGELFGLRWRDVDLEQGRIHPCGKSGSRVVPLQSDTIALLQSMERGAPDAPLFPRGNPSRITEALTRACEMVGCPHWTLHALRRFAVDRLLDAGAKPRELADVLGMSELVALKYYNQSRPAALLALVKRAGLGAPAKGRRVVVRPRVTAWRHSLKKSA